VRSRLYRGGERRLRARATQEKLFHFPLDYGEGRIQHLASGIDDDFALWTQLIEPEADGLANPSFNAIAHHSLSDRARHREADFRAGTLRAADIKSGEQRSGIAGTLIVNSSEISGSQNTNTFRKTCDVTYLSELTVNFLRPRARRRASTARPSAVSMRDRNP
jgi:hypothetical protein